MNYKEHRIRGVSVVEILEPGVVLRTAQDFLDIVSDVCTKKVILKKENIGDSFYDLKTGIAGEILQKAGTYKLALGIVGDFSNVESKSFRDFIYESNITKQIVFKRSAEEILKIFCRKQAED